MLIRRISPCPKFASARNARLAYWRRVSGQTGTYPAAAPEPPEPAHGLMSTGEIRRQERAESSLAAEGALWRYPSISKT
jgi:hypothetical protein